MTAVRARYNTYLAWKMLSNNNSGDPFAARTCTHVVRPPATFFYFNFYWTTATTFPSAKPFFFYGSFTSHHPNAPAKTWEKLQGEDEQH